MGRDRPTSCAAALNRRNKCPGLNSRRARDAVLTRYWSQPADADRLLVGVSFAFPGADADPEMTRCSCRSPAIFVRVIACRSCDLLQTHARIAAPSSRWGHVTMIPKLGTVFGWTCAVYHPPSMKIDISFCPPIPPPSFWGSRASHHDHVARSRRNERAPAPSDAAL